MQSNPEDKVWEELQARLERLHRRYLSSDVQTLEYQPGEMLRMFEMPATYSETLGK